MASEIFENIVHFLMVHLFAWNPLKGENTWKPQSSVIVQFFNCCAQQKKVNHTGLQQHD